MKTIIRNRLALCLSFALVPLAAVSGEERYFGELPVSSWEIAEFVAKSRVVSRVAPNDIAVKRIMAARRAAPRAARGLKPPKAVEKGFEFSGAGADFAKTDLELLSAVTNEDNPSFPPIGHQGNVGACTAWAAAYYMLTNNTAMVRGWDAKSDPELRFSPRWCYNANNMGLNGGSWIHRSIEFLRVYGCGMKSDFDYAAPDYPDKAAPGEYQDLSKDAELWRNALNFRPEDKTFVVDELDTDEGLDRLKGVLANGYVVCFATSDSYGWEERRISGGAHEGKRCVVGMQRTSDPNDGHALTIVGYDDDIWFDANQNKKADVGEKGALRIANSWGNGYHDGGYTWVLYDALRQESALSLDLDDREPLIRDAIAYYAVGQEEYEPLFLAEVSLSCRKRSDVSVWAAIGEYPDFTKKIEVHWLPNPAKWDSKMVALSGRKDETMTFYLDLTDLVTDSGEQEWHVVIEDAAEGNPTSVEEIRLAQWSNGDWVFSDPHPHAPKRYDNTGWRFCFIHSFGDDFPDYRAKSGARWASARRR